MTNLLHRLTHLVPGVPAHHDQPPGHQGSSGPRHHTHADQPPGHQAGSGLHHHSHADRSPGGQARIPQSRRHHHAHTRPPRFMPGWQRRIAALLTRGR
ncbi:hypothetical protein [Actinoplanes sichuanensis]|uniref:Uncharacterized protein n=1 Tax=Actinoplanes sichuanensis TaxID=512349 RepID=A0ABW4AK55_9ACTN|nr:hypothetical protein [Actinoplanes sichuanensis]